MKTYIIISKGNGYASLVWPRTYTKDPGAETASKVNARIAKAEKITKKMVNGFTLWQRAEFENVQEANGFIQMINSK